MGRDLLPRLLPLLILTSLSNCECLAAPPDLNSAAFLDGSGDDSVGLLQKTAKARLKPSIATRSAIASSVAANATELDFPALLHSKDTYCSLFPKFCEPPFNCQTLTKEERHEWDLHGRAADGLPNVRSWCMDPQFMPLMSRCATGDIYGGARLQYELTQAGLYGPTTMELDGSYCFMEGHCVNEEVTNDTTMAEAAEMCNKRFGKEAWTTVGRWDTPPESIIGFAMDEIEDPRNGFTSHRQTLPYMLWACSMGNFHCDIAYCRRHYCKNPYYVKKYGHLLKDYGWVK